MTVTVEETENNINRIHIRSQTKVIEKIVIAIPIEIITRTKII